MSLASIVATVIKIWPELYGFIKIAHSRIREGNDIETIKRSIRRVNEAFGQKNRAEGARMLNDIWRDIDE